MSNKNLYGGDRLSLPNMLCYLRIICAIATFFLILDDFLFLSLSVIILGGLTDFFDGFLARKLNKESEYGKILDPIADKISMLIVCFALILTKKIAVWFCIFIFSKELVFIMAGAYVLKKGYRIVSPIFLSKLNTTLQMFLLIFALLNTNKNLVDFLMISIVILGVFITIQYGFKLVKGAR